MPSFSKKNSRSTVLRVKSCPILMNEICSLAAFMISCSRTRAASESTFVKQPRTQAVEVLQ